MRILLLCILLTSTCFADTHPSLETERLKIRRMVLEDAPDIFAFMSDEHVMQYVGAPCQTTIDDTEQYIKRTWEAFANKVHISWVIEEKETSDIVGVCSLFDIIPAHKRAEIAYIFAQKAWNRGYGTEIAQKLVDFGLNTLDLCRVQATCHPNNHQSAKILEKCGMQYEGYLRNYKVINGVISDRKLYAIIK